MASRSLVAGYHFAVRDRLLMNPDDSSSFADLALRKLASNFQKVPSYLLKLITEIFILFELCAHTAPYLASSDVLDTPGVILEPRVVVIRSHRPLFK